MKLIKEYNILKINGENKNITEDLIILEYPFTIFIDDTEIVTLLCSPKSLKYLAVGFLHSEGFIENYSAIENIQIDREKGNACIKLDAKKNYNKKLQGKRIIASSGLKGTASYSMLDFLKPKKITNPPDISVHGVKKLMETFINSSDLFYTTGGVHACAICNNNNIIYFEEDIGRHNALDKVLGRALVENLDLEDKMVLVSGRISSEMLIKAVKGGITVVVSRSAPTSLAVHIARELNIVLIGFVRGKKMNIYSNFSSLKF